MQGLTQELNKYAQFVIKNLKNHEILKGRTILIFKVNYTFLFFF